MSKVGDSKLDTDHLHYLVVCDGCGVFAIFRNLNSAMWYGAYKAPELHKLCMSKIEADDGHKISVVDAKPHSKNDIMGRF